MSCSPPPRIRWPDRRWVVKVRSSSRSRTGVAGGGGRQGGRQLMASAANGRSAGLVHLSLSSLFLLFLCLCWCHTLHFICEAGTTWHVALRPRSLCAKWTRPRKGRSVHQWDPRTGAKGGREVKLRERLPTHVGTVKSGRPRSFSGAGPIRAEQPARTGRGGGGETGRENGMR